MTNDDFMIGQHRDMSWCQNQYLGLGHNQNLFQGHNQSLGSGQNHDGNVDLGLAYNRDLGLRHTHDHRLSLRQFCEHDLALQHHSLEENGLCLDRDNDPDAHQDDTDVGEHDDQLPASAPDRGLGLSGDNNLALIENEDTDENLSPELDSNQELSIIPASDITVQQPESVVSPVVHQSLALVPTFNHELTVGQEFPDVLSCRRALRDAAIAHRFEMQTIKSDKTRYTAKCASEGCPWRIHAAKLPGFPTFTIRTIHETHTCGGISHLGHHQASVQWVADAVEQQIRENPNCKPKDILEEIHRVHGITLSYKQAWRGKERIMAAVRGSFEEEYRLLPQYCDQIRRTNPGSIALVYGNVIDYCFQHLFVSFQASIYGFLDACRPLIGLNKVLLKSKYLGALLFATGFDGDGAAFPLAFGVVDEDNDDNWMWFLSELHSLLETNAENMPMLTILSDKQKGVVDGVEANFPTAFHSFCMRHLSDCFRKEFNNTILVNLLWEAAQALTIIEFEGKILEIEGISQEAASWVRAIPPRLWATAYFDGTRFGHLTANVGETLNTWILEASGFPIIQMMEFIRRQLMSWFNERREMSMQWTSILVPSAERHVLGALERARTYQVLKANEAEFEVISHEGPFMVNIRSRTCLCRRWQLCGLPCAHAVAALLSCRQNVHRFTESCFTVANYRKTYSQTIHPVPDKTLWKEISEGFQNDGDKDLEVIINPPKSLRPPGQPRKRRVRAEDGSRVKRVVRCSRCNQTGHFRTTCTAPI